MAQLPLSLILQRVQMLHQVGEHLCEFGTHRLLADDLAVDERSHGHVVDEIHRGFVAGFAMFLGGRHRFFDIGPDRVVLLDTELNNGSAAAAAATAR